MSGVNGPGASPELDRERVAGAVDRLHAFLEARFWKEDVLAGPDVGIRFNSRIGRFIKGYTGLQWHSDLTYQQAQAYWLLANWRLGRRTADGRYSAIAAAGSEEMLGRQRADGSWEYPNPEWSGRVATVEGCFAGLALLEAYRQTGEGRFMDGARAWQRCLEDSVGFRRQSRDDHLAVNYWANVDTHGGGVPNNATLVAWFLASLAEAAEDPTFLERVPPLLRWVLDVQLESGELPYAMSGSSDRHRTHFLCAQYNAFEFMDLVHYRDLTGDDSVLDGLELLAGFLDSSITSRWTARYDCDNDRIEVPYYTLAVARALAEAHRLGFRIDPSRPAAMVERVLSLQRDDGGFRFYSHGNYRALEDRLDYPRPLAMMLFHLVELSETT